MLGSERRGQFADTLYFVTFSLDQDLDKLLDETLKGNILSLWKVIVAPAGTLIIEN